tara:strand:+ start:121 stop:657 length:537 start_codon:yes stop_codon:yes gene_type:complete
MKYAEELKRAMEHLAENEKVVFMGQAVADKGTGMTNSLVDIPDSKKIEWTVTEDMQMGASIGMAIDGLIPVSFYPRWNFLCLATNQIVNHLDKMFQMSSGQYNPRVIIRTSIGSQRPLHPQHQHIDDFTDAYRLMCRDINIVRLDEPEQIFEEYDRALNREDGKSTILVEWGDYHGEK